MMKIALIYQSMADTVGRTVNASDISDLSGATFCHFNPDLRLG